MFWPQVMQDTEQSDVGTETLPNNGDDATVERIRFRGCATGGEVTHYRILEAGQVRP